MITKTDLKTKITPLLAITNPVLINEGSIEKLDASGGPLASLIARLWQTMVIIGSLLVVLYFVWGTIEWLTSAGNEDKLKKARGKMIDAFIGLALLVGSFAIIRFLEFVFGFNLLNIPWPSLFGGTN